MGKLKVIKAGPMATIQDFGRHGYRRFGIPQSGAMDKESMIEANQQLGNPDAYPVIEFAIMGMTFEALEESELSVVGASFKVNGGVHQDKKAKVEPGAIVELNAPKWVYAYVGLRGQIKAKEDFESVSTYLPAGFGGIKGRRLKAGDVLQSDENGVNEPSVPSIKRITQNPTIIRIMKGPEWEYLKELPDYKSFKVESSSDRMGIRLNGELSCDYREIATSAVVPGTIQLPANRKPIVLMNDCQTTGGYPRIGKVINEDLGKLAQIKAGTKITFQTL